MAGGTARDFPVPQSSCGIPVSAKAYSLNVTVLPWGALQFLTMYPKGAAFPDVSTLNSPDGQVTANAAIIPAGTEGIIVVYVTDTTDLVIDINGYYAPPGALALAAGTAAAPALTFSNDGNSGFYSPTPGAIAATAAGVNRLEVTAGGISAKGSLEATGDPLLLRDGLSLLRASDGAVGLGLNALGGALGLQNTAVGTNSLGVLTGLAASNSALGYGALMRATTAASNTAMGVAALRENTSGEGNAAVGIYAMREGPEPAQNTVAGSHAGRSIWRGYRNSVAGSSALGNFYGSDARDRDNVALGQQALASLYCCESNTVVGTFAGISIQWGDRNLMLGHSAGRRIERGNDNAYIGSPGPPGADRQSESNALRLGDASQQAGAFVAGVRGVTTSQPAIPVSIGLDGQLGTESSSGLTKRDIRDLGGTSHAIMALRPVRFRYRVHGPGSPEQYGLIAEEVAEVAPELVARGQDGQVDTVLYHKINVMLLNEVQKHHRELQSWQEDSTLLRRRLDELHRQLSELTVRPE
jgi:hypothetical protein